MYKLLIVDDEPAELRFLEWVIKTHSLPFTICGQAANGEEAVALAAQNAPDLIIMDINMPIIDGLEAARLIKQRQPAAVIYILTAHEHFEYAKTAIAVGVEDYLLKPLKPEVLVETLKKGVGKLLKCRLAKIRQEYLGVLAARFKEDLADRLLAEYADREKPPRRDVLPPNRALALNRVQWVLGGFFWRDGRLEKDPYIAQSCLRSLRELSFVEHATIISGGRVAVLGKGQLAAVMPLLRRWAEDWRKSSGISLSAEATGIARRGVEASLRKALRAAAVAQFWEIREVGEAADEQPPAAQDAEAIGQRFVGALLSKGADAALAVLADAMENFRVQRRPREEVRQLLADFVTLVTHDLGELAGEPALGELRQQINHELGRSETVSQVQTCLNGFVAAVAADLANEGESLAKRSVRQAMQYIQKNYHLNISLEAIANKLYLSPSYFSRIFKKHTGQGFANYLNVLRMEKAKTMLMTGRFTVNEVAKKVGIDDASYFSTVFKKYHSLSPSQMLADTGQDFKRFEQDSAKVQPDK